MNRIEQAQFACKVTGILPSWKDVGDQGVTNATENRSIYTSLHYKTLVVKYIPKIFHSFCVKPKRSSVDVICNKVNVLIRTISIVPPSQYKLHDVIMSDVWTSFKKDHVVRKNNANET